MAKIRQFNILHFSKVGKMLSQIAPEEKLSFFSSLKGLPSDLVQNFLPLRFRKSPESYVAIKDNEFVKAFITLEASFGNRRKWFIKRLFLSENSFEEGSQLIDFVITKYGALGADTFCVLIDENDDTSAGLFSKMCGFRLCSREVVWKINSFDFADNNGSCFINCKNNNAGEIADFYNECIEPHFRFSLEKEPPEFKTSFGKNNEKYYVKAENNQILAFCELQKINQTDTLADIVFSKTCEDNYGVLLKGLINLAKQKNRSDNIYVLNRNYMTTAKIAEEFLQNNGFEKVQTKMLLVKDFYKPVKTSETIVNPAVIFNEISGKPAFYTSHSLQKSD